MQQAKRRRREQLVPDLIETVMHYYCQMATVDQVALAERLSRHAKDCIRRSFGAKQRIAMRANSMITRSRDPYLATTSMARTRMLVINDAPMSSLEQAVGCLNYCLQRMRIVRYLSVNISQLNASIRPMMEILFQSERLKLRHLNVSNAFDSSDMPLLEELIRKQCSTLKVIDKIGLDVAAAAISGELRARRLAVFEKAISPSDLIDPEAFLNRRSAAIERLAASGARIRQLVYWTEHGVSPTQVPFFRLLNDARVTSFNLSTLDSQLQLYIPPGSETQLEAIRDLEVYAGRDFYFNAVDVQFAFPILQRFSFRCESIEMADMANAIQLAVQWLLAFPEKLEGYANSYIRTPLSFSSVEATNDLLSQLVVSGGNVVLQASEKIANGCRFLSCLALTSRSGKFQFRIYGKHPRQCYEELLYCEGRI